MRNSYHNSVLSILIAACTLALAVAIVNVCVVPWDNTSLDAQLSSSPFPTVRTVRSAPMDAKALKRRLDEEKRLGREYDWRSSGMTRESAMREYARRSGQTYQAVVDIYGTTADRSLERVNNAANNSGIGVSMDTFMAVERKVRVMEKQLHLLQQRVERLEGSR